MDEKKMLTGAAMAIEAIRAFEDANSQFFGQLQLAGAIIAYKRLFGWKRFFMPSWWKLRRFAKAVFSGQKQLELQRFGWEYLDPRVGKDDPKPTSPS